MLRGMRLGMSGYCELWLRDESRREVENKSDIRGDFIRLADVL